MKAIIILLSLGLVVSIGFNVMYWRELEKSASQEMLLQLTLSDLESARTELEGMKNSDGVTRRSVEDYQRELGRLRNEVAQFRRKEKETEAEKARMVAETAALKTQVSQGKGTQSTGSDNLTPYDAKLAELANLTPDQVLELKAEAHSVRCVSNLKQIGLALHVWANAHGGFFPPDLLAAKEELSTPKILFCTASPAGVAVKDWAQFNPATLSYQYLNPNGTSNDGKKPLTTCPIHGHVGYSDGSVSRK